MCVVAGLKCVIAQLNRSIACKGHQLADISDIGRSQRMQVGSARSATARQIGLVTPRKRYGADFAQQAIRYQPRVPAIAVRKRMNHHQLMVKSHCNFIDRENFVIDPKLRVVEQLAKPGRNLPPITTDVFVRPPECAGPFPGFSEHVLVQHAAERFREHGGTSISLEPFHGADDIRLLPFVELPLRRNVFGNELRGFVWIKRSLARLIFKRYCHSLDHFPASNSARRWSS